MPVPVVVALEMVDVDEDAAPPRLTAGPEFRLEVEEETPVVAARQRIARQLFSKPVLQLLPARDVDQHAVVSNFARLGITRCVRGVEDRSPQPVGPHDLELELPNAPFAGEDPELLLPSGRIGEQLRHFVALNLFEGGNAEDLQERWVRVQDPPLTVRDVDPFVDGANEQLQGLGVVERADASTFHLLLIRLGFSHWRCEGPTKKARGQGCYLNFLRPRERPTRIASLGHVRM